MIQAALDTCNELRKMYCGLPPVTEMQKGVRSSTAHCPVARTISAGSLNYVSAAPPSMYLGGLRKMQKIKPVPDSLREFMVAFDQGQFPELEL